LLPEGTEELIDRALQEDIGPGDHTSLATIPATARNGARLLVKDTGVLAGVELARAIARRFDEHLDLKLFLQDGATISHGDVAFTIMGPARSILTVERLMLNFMQRMSGIATLTHRFVEAVQDTGCRILDTRKTTPGLRMIEKWAVRIGGGHNHRHGLYDMIMIKDNHVDYAGGIRKAIEATQHYLKAKNLDLKIELEVRNFEELKEALEVGGMHRIMLDNFTPENIKEALKLIPDHIETEASGGITEETIVDYAETGVDFISVGALTHSIRSLDLSLKAV
jgi:nicotinate-nucleotide pyrophosphorylase (carboxylating)